MANENTILTALGLDLSQFDAGTKSAVSSVKPLLGAIATVDTELRKIPIVGEIYSATFGKIAEGFAETRLQAREFARIMQTDVAGSLDGTMKQIDDINDSLKNLKEGGFARSISDFLANAKKEYDKKGLLNMNLNTTHVQDDREKQIAALQKRREDDIQNIIGLMSDEAKSQSAIISGSQEETDNLRAALVLREKTLELVRQAQKIGGPDAAKWSETLKKSIADQAQLNIDIYNKQTGAAAARRADRAAELDAAKKIADAQLQGNERDIAYLEEKLALEKLANAEKTGVKEDIAAAQAAVQIARQRTELAQHQYDLAVQQASIETALMASQVEGQTRLAKQLEIQARYQVQIQEAMRRGNSELAKQLAKQAKLSQLQEAIRQYELGGRGRAAERRTERRRARIARIVQSRLDRRAQGDAPTGGLRSGGLRAGGGLARPKPAAPKPEQKPIPNQTIQDFMQTVTDALTK